ncbi:MAG: uroporphyrinogen-III decarboxylase [Candidatus Bathyarchaeota archaeon B26-2]|nr:MAG: uroporphyrinogen-III decarboxylase [Candidatus Bathyarchaeota archaeon B26-2]
MSHRERFFTALELGEPDMVPVTDLGLDPPIVEAILGRTLSGFSLITVSGEGGAWETSVKNRIALSEACVKLGFDAVPAVSDYTLCSRKYKPKTLSGGRFIDEWGRILEPRLENKTTWYVGGTVTSEEEMEEYLPPDPEEEGRFELVERVLNSLKGKDIAVMCQGHSGWHMAFQVRGGIDKILIDMYRKPDVVRRFMDKVAKACLGMVKLMIDAGVEVLFITDDYADCHSTLMNPSQFREFELPNIKKVVETARRKGIPVLKHSDGNVESIIEDMIDAGIRGFHPFEPGAMDLKEAKVKYGGRICILGNVDCRYVLPFGSEEDVRKDVRRCIDAAAEGGGYILASSNSIHANCKVENVYTMVDEARRYGRYSSL